MTPTARRDPVLVPVASSAVRERIAAAAPDPAAVRLVAVTKGFGVDTVRAALDAGLADIGESYVQELVAKAVELDAEIDDGAAPARSAAPPVARHRAAPAQQGAQGGALRDAVAQRRPPVARRRDRPPRARRRGARAGERVG